MMIRIMTNLGRNHVRVEGHARSPRTANGIDLVCCAVSTLIMALMYTLQRLSGVYITADVQDGYSDIAVYPDEDCPHDVWVEALSRVQMTRDGLMMLAAEYPAYIRIHPPDSAHETAAPPDPPLDP